MPRQSLNQRLMPHRTDSYMTVFSDVPGYRIFEVYGFTRLGHRNESVKLAQASSRINDAFWEIELSPSNQVFLFPHFYAHRKPIKHKAQAVNKASQSSSTHPQKSPFSGPLRPYATILRRTKFLNRTLKPGVKPPEKPLGAKSSQRKRSPDPHIRAQEEPPRKLRVAYGPSVSRQPDIYCIEVSAGGGPLWLAV